MSTASTRRTWYEAGLIPRSRIPISDDPSRNATGCFYGRQALNVDLLRELLSVTPGSAAEDFERDVLGFVREEVSTRKTVRRYPLIGARMPVVAVRQWRGIGRVHDSQLRWWRKHVLQNPPELTARDLLMQAEQRMQTAFGYHMYTRGLLLPAVQGPLHSLAVDIGGPELASALFGGLGDTAESEIAGDMWELSRDRLSITEFVRRHGFHGPAEGNPIGRVWRENPSPVVALARAYASRPESDAPSFREQEARAKHQSALQALLSGVSAIRRPAVRGMVTALRAQVRYLGLGKASFLMGIDGIRAGARKLGAELVDSGIAADPDDTFYLTLDELRGTVPENFTEIVAFRRARREEYRTLELPIVWTGVPEPITPAQATDAEILTGIAGAGGIVEGPARVVHDPDTADELEPGEILVCHFTDPSWAALFPLAAAVVIDIGGVASHGAVVARELGIPCVIGTGSGTRTLRTGNVVRVNGGAGTVEVLNRAQRAS